MKIALLVLAIRFLRRMIRWMAILSGGTLLILSLLIVLDIVLRSQGQGIYGVYDLVGIGGALTIAGAMPLTKALKGHVAIEYFYHKRRRLGRQIMDVISRTLMTGFFMIMTVQAIRYGIVFYHAHEVSPTLYVPLFWLPWVFAWSFALTTAVTIFHLMRPGKPFMHLSSRGGK